MKVTNRESMETSQILSNLTTSPKFRICHRFSHNTYKGLWHHFGHSMASHLGYYSWKHQCISNAIHALRKDNVAERYSSKTCKLGG